MKYIITTKYITDIINELRKIIKSSESTKIIYDSKFKPNDYILETDIPINEIKNLFWLDKIECEHTPVTISQDTHVYCTKCIWSNIDEEGIHCPWTECDSWNFEDSRPFRERPHYEAASETN